MGEDLLSRILIPVILTLIASSGFWALLEKRSSKTTGQAELLLGLAHDRLRHLCMKAIEQGFINQDDYEDLINYLYKPYLKMGGNGSILRLMEQVNRLPLKLPQNVQKEL